MQKGIYRALVLVLTVCGNAGCKSASKSYIYSVGTTSGRSAQQLVFFTDTASIRQVAEATEEDTVRYHGVVTLFLTDTKGMFPKTVNIPCVLLVEKKEFVGAAERSRR